MKMTLNGSLIEAQPNPNETLLDFLRNRMRMTSVKKGCDVGECGTCTVLLDGKAVRSCLVLALQAENREILTLEGLEEGGKLHPIQEAFLEKYGFQCGYCTPGMILATKALLDGNADPSLEDIKEALEGNLCRCTGYEQIVESALRAVEIMKTKARS
jgi:carbon-monoxide dehydrogenase small subunit